MMMEVLVSALSAMRSISSVKARITPRSSSRRTRSETLGEESPTWLATSYSVSYAIVVKGPPFAFHFPVDLCQNQWVAFERPLALTDADR